VQSTDRTAVKEFVKSSWNHFSPSEKEYLVSAVIEADDLDLFKWLVQCGMSLLAKDCSFRPPVDILVMGRHPRIIEWCAKRHDYKDMVPSGRRMIEAMYDGDPDHLMAMLELGGSLLEDAGRGSALSMALEPHPRFLGCRDANRYSDPMLSVMHAFDPIAFASLLVEHGGLQRGDARDVVK
jgi:hypothetical protein